jgi:hypothetical protein
MPGRRRLLPVIAMVALAAVTLIADIANGKTKPAYCNISSAGVATWAFHVGSPIFGVTGTYARGHGSLSGNTTGGTICQVDRVKGAADRQIILTVGRKLVYFKHAVSFGGHLGNILKLSIKVKSSTDPACGVGTVGKLTLTATYNGFKRDTATFKFPAACKDHDHSYTGSKVVVLIPPHT